MKFKLKYDEGKRWCECKRIWMRKETVYEILVYVILNKISM